MLRETPLCSQPSNERVDVRACVSHINLWCTRVRTSSRKLETSDLSLGETTR